MLDQMLANSEWNEQVYKERWEVAEQALVEETEYSRAILRRFWLMCAVCIGLLLALCKLLYEPTFEKGPTWVSLSIHYPTFRSVTVHWSPFAIKTYVHPEGQ